METIPEHRTKTPRMEKENRGTARPPTNAPRDCISRSAPLTLMNLFLLRGSAYFFYFTLPWVILPPRASPAAKKIKRAPGRNSTEEAHEIFHWKNRAFFATFFSMHTQ